MNFMNIEIPTSLFDIKSNHKDDKYYYEGSPPALSSYVNIKEYLTQQK